MRLISNSRYRKIIKKRLVVKVESIHYKGPWHITSFLSVLLFVLWEWKIASNKSKRFFYYSLLARIITMKGHWNGGNFLNKPLVLLFNRGPTSGRENSPHSQLTKEDFWRIWICVWFHLDFVVSGMDMLKSVCLKLLLYTLLKFKGILGLLQLVKREREFELFYC